MTTDPGQAAPAAFEAPHALGILQGWMKENDVATIALDFHGDSDEGEVALADITPRHALSLQINGEDLEDALVDFGYDVLEKFARGWEEDEGARGDLHIEAGSATLNFGKRREEVQWGDPVDLAEVGLAEVSVLQEWMKAHGVRGLMVSLTAYNDEGQVEVSNIDPPEARNIEIEGQDLDEFIIFVDEFVSGIHDGWENNFGGEGAVEFTQDSAILEFGLREERFQYEERALVAGPEPESLPSP